MRNAGPWSLLSSGLLLLLAACSNTSNTCANGCRAGLSCTQNSDFPTGACTAVCDGGSCPSGMVCSPQLSSGQGYCLQECALSGCPGSMVCTLTSEGKLCLPEAGAVATPIGCPAPQLLVGPAAGPGSDPGCRIPVVASALASGDVQALGTFSPNTQVSFNVPAGAAGFSIVSQAVQPTNDFLNCQGQVVPNVPVPSPLLTPTGQTFFDITASVPLDWSTAPLLSFGVAGQQPFSASLTFPNTSAGVRIALDGGLPGGQWRFNVNDYANEFAPGTCTASTLANVYDVTVVVTPGPLPPTGQLAVDIYLVTDGLDAGSAVSSTGVRQFASRFASFYANAGVCLSTVTFHDVPAWALDKYRSLDVAYDVIRNPCSDFRQMFTLAESGRSMALFFVDEMVLANGEPAGAIGIDGAIPGNATFNGTIAGGAVVLSSDFSATGCTTTYQPTTCGPDVVAAVAAHETGHFLGLVHPTEATGDFFDPLADTPACVCALCETDPGLRAACGSNPDGGLPTVMDETVCGGSTQLCSGANLLMYWVVTTNGDITPEQAAVMRANPLISAP